MVVNSDVKHPSWHLPLPSHLPASIGTPVSTRRTLIQRDQGLQAKPGTQNTSLAFHRYTSPSKRVSTSVIGLREISRGHEPTMLLKPLPLSKHRRSMGIVAVTRSEAQKTSESSPECKIPQTWPPSKSSKAKPFGSASISSRSPLKFKEPKTSHKASVPQSEKVPKGPGFPLSGSSLSLAPEHLVSSGPPTLSIENHTVRMSRFSTHTSQTEVNHSKKIVASAPPPKLTSLLTSHGHHSQNSERLSLRVKTGLASKFNKSEPHLPSHSASGAIHFPINLESFGYSASSDILKSKQMPLSTHPSSGLGERHGSFSLSKSDIMQEKPTAKHQHQRIKSNIDKTLKKKAVFTSRLRYTAAAKRMPSEFDESQPSFHASAQESHSIALISDCNSVVDEGNPVLISKTSLEQSSLTMVHLITGENPPEKGNVTARNSRIHSPAFYRSLKNRWKTTQSIRRELPPFPMEESPKTDDKFTPIVLNDAPFGRTPKQPVGGSDEFHSSQVTFSRQSSRSSLVDFLLYQGPKKNAFDDGIRTIGVRKSEECETMATPPARSHILARLRAASVSSSLSKSSSTSLKNAQGNLAFERHIRQLKHSKLHKTDRQYHLSGSSHRNLIKAKDTVQSTNEVSPEDCFARPTLLSENSSHPNLVDIPEGLQKFLSAVQQPGAGDGEERITPSPKTPIIIGATPGGSTVLADHGRRETEPFISQQSAQRNSSSEKLGPFPSPRLEPDATEDLLLSLPFQEGLLQGFPWPVMPNISEACGDTHLGGPAGMRPILNNGSERVKSGGQAPSQLKVGREAVTERSTLSPAKDLGRTNDTSSNPGRFSRISVPKSKESLKKSTPESFQEMCKKDFEENERKCKQLVGLEGREVQSTDLTNESAVTNLEIPMTFKTTKIKTCKTVFDALKEADQTAQITSPDGPFQKGHSQSATETSECLQKIWNSFKLEAEISLSEISCEISLIDDQLRNLDHMVHHHKLQEIEMFDHENSTRKQHIKSPLPNSHLSASVSRSSLLDHGLVDAKSSHQFEETKFTSTLLANNQKLKRLSLSSDQSFNTSTKRPPLPRSSESQTDDSFNYSTILDPALVNAFPSPPRKSRRSSASSISSYSNKPAIPPETDGSGLLLLARFDEETGPNNSLELVSRASSGFALRKPNVRHAKPFDPHVTQGPIPNNDINFPWESVRKPISFSNRPRAQSGALRAPVPAPLRISLPVRTSFYSASKTKTWNMGLVKTPMSTSTRYSIKSPFKATLASVSPPFSGKPDHSPPSLASGQDSRDLNNYARSNAQSPSSSTKLSPSLLTPGGMSPKVSSTRVNSLGGASSIGLSAGSLITKPPSLAIRPRLAPTRSSGIYLTPGAHWPVSQGDPHLPQAKSLSPVVATQNRRSPAYSSTTAAKNFITDLHNDLIEQTRDAAQPISMYATYSSKKMPSCVGVPSASINSSNHSPCTPSLFCHAPTHHIPPVPRKENYRWPTFANSRPDRVSPPPSKIPPLTFVDSAQLLRTPRSMVSKGDPSKPPTPSTKIPSTRSSRLTYSSPSMGTLQFQPSTRPVFPVPGTLRSPKGNTPTPAPNGTHRGEWVSYGMAM